MDLKRRVLISSLNRIFRKSPDFLEKLEPSFTVQSVSDNGIDFDVNFPASTDLTQIEPNQFYRINKGQNVGFNYVKTVGTDLITSENLIDNDYETTLDFYNIDVPLYEIYANSAIQYAERITNNSFTGVKDFVDFVNGTGTDLVLLKRKKIRSITQIQIVDYYYLNYFLPAIVSPQDLDETYYKEKGILRIVPRTSILVNNVKFFPRKPIRVFGTFGYNEDEVPSDVLEALSLICTANMLTEDANEDGNLGSFSIDGYSESYSDPNGRFGKLIISYRKLANSILSQYSTGIM